VTDTGFDFSFAIGSLDRARQSHGTAVGEHIAMEWVGAGIVEVGDQYAFLYVVEHHDARAATESSKGFLV